MTQPLSHQGPSHVTHIPELAELPPEPKEDFDDRPDEPTPSLWQRSVKVKHRVSGREAVVVRVDWRSNMFRAFYPDERDRATGEMGRYATRREWEQCSEWIVETTFAPAELARREAHRLLEEALSKLDAKGAAAVAVFCDDPDPAKNLAKMEALIALGVIKVDAPAEAIVESAAKGKK